MRNLRTSKLIGGAAAGQVIALLAYPLLTRLYSPAELGVLSVYTSVLGIFAVAASLRYEQAIPLPRSDIDAMGLLVLSLSIAIVVAIVSGLAVWVWPEILNRSGDSSVPAIVGLLLPVGVLFAAVYQALSMFSLRIGHYGKLGLTRAVQSMASAAVQILGGVVSGGSVLLIAGHLIGQSAGSGTLAINVIRRLKDARPSFSEIGAVARRYRKFAYLGMPSALLNTSALLLPVVLIASEFNLKVAGFYGLATLVLSAPVQLIGRSSAQVFFADASRARHEHSEVIRPMLSSITRRLIIFALLPTIILAFAGPWLFAIVFGGTWAVSGEYAAILVTANFLALVSSPASQTFLVVERQGISLMLNVLKLIVTVVSFGFVPLLNSSVVVAIASYSAGMVGYYILVIVYAFKVLPSKIGG